MIIHHPPPWCPDHLPPGARTFVVHRETDQQALAAAPPPRWLTITTWFDIVTTVVQLWVTDNGPGVLKTIRPRILEPFFPTKPTGLRTGIGLSVCQGIVRSHIGAIAIDDAKGGAAFTLDLPIAVLGPPAIPLSPDGGERAYSPCRDSS